MSHDSPDEEDSNDDNDDGDDGDDGNEGEYSPQETWPPLKDNTGNTVRILLNSENPVDIIHTVTKPRTTCAANRLWSRRHTIPKYSSTRKYRKGSNLDRDLHKAASKYANLITDNSFHKPTK